MHSANSVNLLAESNKIGVSVLWDSLSNSGILEKAGHQISFHAGDPFVLHDFSKLVVSDSPELKNGVLFVSPKFMDDVKDFFKDAPNTITGFFDNAGTWLTTSGNNIINSLRTGINEKWTDVQTFFGNSPTVISDYFKNAGNWLTSAGSNIISSLRTGLGDRWPNVTEFIGNIGTSFIGYFDNAVNWLVNAGKNILIGFYNGLVDAWNQYVTGFITNIAQWIADHKGPESYDRQLLVPNGQWIMEDRGAYGSPSTNGLIYNNASILQRALCEGDFIRIDDGVETIAEGVLFVFAAPDSVNTWNTVPLSGQQEITIGRAQGCSILLPHISVSKLHAKIVASGGHYYIVDNGSTNGVVVNNQRITGKQDHEFQADLYLPDDFLLLLWRRYFG